MTTLFKVTLTSWASSVRTLLVQLQGPTGPDGRPIPGDAVEAWQPAGLRARPLVRPTSEALVVELPNGERIALYVDKARLAGGVEPESGGVALVGDAAPATTIYLRASGAIEITAAAGQAVTLQGGAEPFVRGTAYANALDDFLDGLDTFVTGVGAYATAVGAIPGPLAATAPAAATLAGVVTTTNAAIAAFKLARTGYLSTRIAGD